MVVFGSIIMVVVFFGLQYLVIRYGVLHALRAHAVSSTMGVSIVSSGPLRVAQVSEAEAEPERS